MVWVLIIVNAYTVPNITNIDVITAVYQNRQKCEATAYKVIKTLTNDKSKLTAECYPRKTIKG